MGRPSPYTAELKAQPVQMVRETGRSRRSLVIWGSLGPRWATGVARTGSTAVSTRTHVREQQVDAHR